MKEEIRDLVEQIDEKNIEHISEPKRKLIRFLKEVYPRDKAMEEPKESP